MEKSLKVKLAKEEVEAIIKALQSTDTSDVLPNDSDKALLDHLRSGYAFTWGKR